MKILAIFGNYKLYAMTNKILDLIKELSGLLPMSAENKSRLDNKIRLEFNYNSNHIEGNTLTYGETQLLLMKGQASGDHDKRELDEMEAHDVAFSMIQKWAEDKQRQLTEADIKTLNKVILVKPFYKEALTEDGQSTRRQIEVGKYKAHPNSVLLSNGEMHHYASPIDTPNLMKELMDWYRTEEKKGKLHPVELAALWHYKFVSIHPFDDGNGRVARLIMNYILFKADMPPIIIKSADKKAYLQALNKADVGDIDAFIQYVIDQLEDSLNLFISAAKGEKIEEQDDWMKELEVFRKKEDNTSEVRDYEMTKERILDSLFPLIEEIENISEYKILPLFESMNFHIISLNSDITAHFKNKVLNLTERYINLGKIHHIHFVFTFIRYKKDGQNTFNVQIKFNINFSDYTYIIGSEEMRTWNIKKNIDEKFDKSDIKKAINAFGKEVTNKIKSQLK